MSDHTTNTPTKQCSKCNGWYPATTDYFGKLKKSDGGLNPWCKTCLKDYNRQYQAANRERIAANSKAYAEANKDKIAEYKRQWADEHQEHLKAQRREYYEANRDEILAEQAEYRKANPELIRQRKHKEYERHKDKYIRRAANWQANNKERVNELARKAWSENRNGIKDRRKEYEARNTEKIKERARKWKAANREKINALARMSYAENPEQFKARSARWLAKNAVKVIERIRRYKRDNPDKVRLWNKVNRQTRAARKNNLPDLFTEQDWKKCLDFFGGCCAACGNPPSLFDDLQADHFVPLASPDCIGTVPTNVIPLCLSCNSSKRDKNATEWAIKRFGRRKAKEFIERVEQYFMSIQ